MVVQKIQYKLLSKNRLVLRVVMHMTSGGWQLSLRFDWKDDKIRLFRWSVSQLTHIANPKPSTQRE